MFGFRCVSKFIELSYDRPRFSVSLDICWDVKNYKRPSFIKFTIGDTKHIVFDCFCVGGTWTNGTPNRWWA